MGKHLDIFIILFVVIRMQYSKTEDEFSNVLTTLSFYNRKRVKQVFRKSTFPKEGGF
jgi:hypothetical protein